MFNHLYPICLVILTLWSCQKPREAVTPKSPADCRIIATVYKTTIEGRESGPKYDLETIVLSDGRLTNISKVITTFYKYDEEGRVIQQDKKWPNGDYRTTKYSYLSDRLAVNVDLFASLLSPTVRTSRDTVSLYPNGLRSRVSGVGVPYIKYNSDGQFQNGDLVKPSDSCRYENGNCTEKIQFAWWVQQDGRWIPTDYQLIRYRYDLTKPNIRPFLQFEGNSSRNLPLTEHLEVKASTQFPDGLVYQKAYLYTFDKHGRVTRRIAHGKSLYRGWLIEDDYNGVGVTDYIYECP
jgi:hypothetical protein